MHARAIEQHALNFCWIQIHPARHHSVGSTPRHKNIALCIHITQVTEREHTWANMCSSCFLRRIQIHHAFTTVVNEIQPAYLANWHFHIVVVYDMRRKTRQTLSCRAFVLQPLQRSDGAHGACFSTAITVNQNGPHPIDHCFFHRNGARRTGVVEQSK